MNKRKLRHQYKKVKGFKPWYFLAICLIFLGIGVYGLRQNNLKTIELTRAVAMADQQNGDVEAALRGLRAFVYAHMNTNLSSSEFAIKPPIQLKNRYESLAKKEANEIKTEQAEVKNRAEKICAKHYPGGGINRPRISCVAKYINDHEVKNKPIPSELYKFDFVGPSWSPDLAGLSLLASAVFFALFVIRVAIGWWYRAEL